MKMRISLKKTLITSFIFVSLLPFLATSFWVAQHLGLIMEKEASSKNILLAESVASELDKLIKIPVHHLEQVATMLDQGMIANDKVDEFFNYFVKTDDLFNMIVIIDHQGIVTDIFPFDSNSLGLDMSNQKYFQKASLDKKIYWSKTFISLQTGMPTVTLSLPFSRGVLLGHINLSFLNDITDTYTIGSSGHVQITDSTGNVIAHPDRVKVLERFNTGHFYHIQQGLAGNKGTYPYKLNNIEMIASVTSVPRYGWIVSVSQPVKDILAPIQTVKSFIYSGLFVAVIIATVISIICFRLLLTPLTNLVEASKAITDGDYTSRFQTGSYLELEQLANALNTMVDAVKQREESLQDEVSSRILAEKNLKDNQEQLQAILDHSPALISIKNLAGTILLVNKKFHILRGSLPGEFIGKTSFDLFPKDVAESLWANDLSALEKDEAIEVEEIMQHDDGTLHTYFSIKFPLKDDKGQAWGLCAISTDISERKKFEVENKKLEVQLHQSQKMESIGTLAGGIAHDFNNILSAIIGYTELALMDIDHPDTLQQDLNEVLRGSLRAKELVQQILTFSRRNNLELIPLRAQLIVKEALKLIRSSIPTTIAINQNIDPHCQAILADPSQIHQVVMNLCTNGYHAMRETGGVLDVSLQEIELPAGDVPTAMHLKPGPYLKLEISDTGGGMTKDVMGRIFEPYYTTKEQGEGTGLGLAVVHGIITRLHGHISVASEPGKGTTFTIYLPTIADVQKTVPQERSNPAPTGHEQILIVDDDDAITQLNQKILTGLGYTVTASTHPNDILHLFQENPAKYDLLITDMTMPDMTGEELARQILSVRPEMPIILCTGYSEKMNEEKAKALGICRYLVKPLVTKDLAVAVRNVLDGSKHPPLR